MKEIKNDIIKKYKYKDYVVYVKENSGCYEYYLQNEEYGNIDLMYGLSKENEEQNMIIVYNNMEKAIKIYKEKYKD